MLGTTLLACKAFETVFINHFYLFKHFNVVNSVFVAGSCMKNCETIELQLYRTITDFTDNSTQTAHS